MRACSAGLIATLLAGCSDERVLFLATEGLASVVLVYPDADEVEAFDVRSAPIRRARPDETVLAVGYHATLEALELSAGPIAVDPRGGPLPTADRYHRLGEDADAWETLASAPDEVSELRVAQRDTCARFALTTEVMALAEAETVTFAVELDAATILFATSAGRFFRVAGDGRPQRVALSTTTPSLAAYRAADGELWLAGAGGRMVRGDLLRGFEEAPRIPLDPRAGLVLDGAHGAAPFELFAADGERAVAHFDGTTWRRVFEGNGRQRRELRPQIAWAEPGRAVLIGVGTSSVVEVSADGGVRTVRLEIPARASYESPWAVAYIADRGVVVGTHYDVLYVRENGAFTMMGEPPITPRADVLVDLGGRAVLAGGQNGSFVQLRAQDDFCEPMRLRTGQYTHVAARLGAGLVYVASSTTGEARVITAARIEPRD